MPKEILTLYTKLLVNRGAADEELIDLLSTPDLGIGDPEKVEVTNLQDGTRRYVNGLKDVGDSLEFEFNYVTDNYQVLKEIEESKQIYTYKVVLPDKLCFKFDAALSVKITGAAVGEQVKMTINLTPYSTIEVGPYDDNAGQQSRYSTFTIGQSRARSAGTLNLVNTSSSSIEELYINNVAQELPTGVTNDETDDRPAVITNYEVNPGDIIKIKGGFSLWETELPINNVVLQKDLKSCRMMFYGCTGLTETPIIPEGVENCSFMFDGCTGLTQAPVIPSSAIDCSMMFTYCTGLTEAPVIPNGVTNCAGMLAGTGLTEAPVIPSSVTNCMGMFMYCSGLTEAPIIPSSATDCTGMFAMCTNLTAAPQIPEGVTNCMSMFVQCSNLTQAPVIPSSVTNCMGMFMECANLAAAPIIPQSVRDCSYMFSGCSNLTTIPQENIDMMSNPPEGLIFEGCYNECPLVADSIPTSWGGTKVEEPEEVPGLYTTFTVGEAGALNLANTTRGSIKELYINNVAQELPTGMNYNNTTAYTVENGQKIKIKGEFSLNGTTLLIKDIVLQSDLTDCSSMFMGCTGLTQAPVIPSSVIATNHMFHGCASLTEAPVIPMSVKYCSGMFSGCTSLTEAPVMPSNITNYDSMFSGCTSLTEAPVIPSSVTSCNSMFYGCTSLTEAPIIPSSVTSCNYMFYGCTSLTKLPEENVNLMNNPPTGLSYSCCYAECEKIVDPIRYDQIPDGWK